MDKIITSRDNETVKYICKLNRDTAFRRAENAFVCEGVKLCMDIAKLLQPKMVLYTKKALAQQNKIDELNGEKFEISDSVAEKISEVKTPQGIFCVFDMPQSSIESIDKGGFYLALERVQDPSNVGAIIRSAVAFGISGIIMSDSCADIYSAKAIRASMSGAVKLPIYVVSDMPKTLQMLNSMGMETAAARLEKSVELSMFKPKSGFCIVIGNEGQGVSCETAEVCTCSIRIPMSENIESLNAAVAAGVLMWHYRRF